MAWLRILPQTHEVQPMQSTKTKLKSYLWFVSLIMIHWVSPKTSLSSYLFKANFYSLFNSSLMSLFSTLAPTLFQDHVIYPIIIRIISILIHLFGLMSIFTLIMYDCSSIPSEQNYTIFVLIWHKSNRSIPIHQKIINRIIWHLYDIKLP